MARVRRLKEVPTNFGDFVDEIGEGLRGLYGEAAEKDYRSRARGAMKATVDNPLVAVFGAMKKRAATGLVIAVRRQDVGHVSFIHVLSEHTGQGIEGSLVRAACEFLHEGGSTRIVSECVAHCPLDVQGVYEDLGFLRVERAIMCASCKDLAAVSDGGPRSREFHAREARAAARTIVASFQNHSGRLLHHEVRTVDRAHEFLRSVRSGSYGRFQRPYGRVVDIDGNLPAVLVGCEVAPDVGFVLMVSVVPENQGHGLGTGLLLDVAHEFMGAGLDRVALGVSLDNPAAGLYARLGFSELKRVDAYVTQD